MSLQLVATLCAAVLGVQLAAIAVVLTMDLLDAAMQRKDPTRKKNAQNTSQTAITTNFTKGNLK